MLMMSTFLWLIGGLGSSKHPSISETNGMIASFILFPAAYHGSLAPAAFTTGAEIGTAALREKTMALAVKTFCEIAQRDIDKILTTSFRLL